MHFLSDGAAGGTPLLIQMGTVLVALVSAVSAIKMQRNKTDEEQMQRYERLARDCQADLLTLQGYIYSLRSMVAAQGINTPEPPRLRTEDAGGKS